MSSPTLHSLQAIWGSSDNDIYAVGLGGTVLWFDGGNWNVIPGPDNHDLIDVHGGGGNVYAISGLRLYGIDQAGRWIIRSVSCTTDPYNESCTQLKSVWAGAQGDYCAVGQYANYRYLEYIGFMIGLGASSNGSLMYSMVTLYDVWGASQNDIYAIGEAQGGPNHILHFDGNSWGGFPIQPPEILERIGGASASEVFGVTDLSGRLVLFNGTSWSLVDDSPYMQKPTGMWGSSSSNIYIITDGILIHYDGSVFEIYGGSSAIGPNHLCDVWATAPDNAYAAGERRGLYHYDGYEWSYTEGVSGKMNSIWGSSDTDIYAVGDGGRILHYNGGFWSESIVDADVLWDVAGRSGNDVYAVGEKNFGRVFHFNGGSWWTVIGTTIGPAATSICVTPGYVFVGTADGRIYRYDGGGWIMLGQVLANNGEGRPIHAIWGSAGDTLIVGGTAPYIAKVDGISGQVIEQIVPVDIYLYKIRSFWGTSLTNLFVAGEFQYSSHDIFHLSASGLFRDSRTKRVVNGLFGTNSCDIFAVGEYGSVLFLDLVGDGTQISALSQSRSMTIMPGEEVCNSFQVSPSRRFIEVDFNVFGANVNSGRSQTAFDGRVRYCYIPDRPGTDRLYPSLVVPGVDYSADTLTLQLSAPQLTFDSAYHSDGDTLYALFGVETCTHTQLNVVRSGVIVDFTVSGANPSGGVSITNVDGKTTFCYPVSAVGTDTITAAATFDFPLEQIFSSDELVLNIESADLLVDSDLHSATDTVIIVPGDSVFAHFKTVPPIENAVIDFSVTGENTVQGTAQTDANGSVTWPYRPLFIGADTITAASGGFSQAVLPVFLEHPVLSYDPFYQGVTDSVLVIPGGEVTIRFALSPHFAGTSVDFQVAGANSSVASGFTDGWGCVNFSYPALATGVDTIIANADFDYGGAVYTSTDTATLNIYPPSLVIDNAYHTGKDSVIVPPNGTICGHFIITPAIENVALAYTIRGANPQDGTTSSDASGRVSICYQAFNAGSDSIFVKVDLQNEDPVLLVLEVVQGSDIPLFLYMTTALAPDDFRAIDVVLSSNKELDSPSAVFFLQLPSGDKLRSQLSMNLRAGSSWIYQTQYRCDQNGWLTVSITASDLYGICEEKTATYDLGRVDRYAPLDWTSNDGTVRIRAQPLSVTTSGLVMVARDSIQTTPMLQDGTELEPVSSMFHISTSSIFHAAPSLSIRYGDGTRPDIPSLHLDVRKVGIYQCNGDVWTYIGGQGNGKTVSSDVSPADEYAALYNPAHEVVPSETVLFQNYPNPFRPSTTITLDLHEEGPVELAVYTIAGERVKTLIKASRDPGVHEIPWYGTNENGNPVATGVYFYRLKTKSTTQTKKMVLIR